MLSVISPVQINAYNTFLKYTFSLPNRSQKLREQQCTTCAGNSKQDSVWSEGVQLQVQEGLSG